MAVPLLELHCDSPTDTYPLLMEQAENHNQTEHVIDINRSADASQLTAIDPPSSTVSQPSLSSSNESNPRNSQATRGNGYGRRRRSPLNSGLWISVELVLTLSQIIASIVVLSLSRNEKPRAPLFAWIVGYASGCVATLPLLYWRYQHRNQTSEQDSGQNRPASPHSNLAVGPAFYSALSLNRNTEGDDRQTHAAAVTRNGESTGILSSRCVFFSFLFPPLSSNQMPIMFSSNYVLVVNIVLACLCLSVQCLQVVSFRTKANFCLYIYSF